MPDLEKKLELFTRTVLSEAESQKEKAVQKIEQEKNSIIKEKELELLGSAYEDIQAAVAKCSKENNERVLKLEMELKKNIIKKREDIIGQVFQDANEKLEAFIASPEYEAWLIGEAKKGIGEAGNGTINITARDEKYGDALKAAFPGCTVNVYSNDEIIGGAIVTSGSISSDHSIKEALEAQRQSFLRTSGLSIKA